MGLYPPLPVGVLRLRSGTEKLPPSSLLNTSGHVARWTRRCAKRVYVHASRTTIFSSTMNIIWSCHQNLTKRELFGGRVHNHAEPHRRTHQ
jgi:hypothetical protein